jgi:hypothetical protein
MWIFIKNTSTFNIGVSGKNKRDGVSTGMGFSIKENYGKRLAASLQQSM